MWFLVSCWHQVACRALYTDGLTLLTPLLCPQLDMEPGSVCCAACNDANKQSLSSSVWTLCFCQHYRCPGRCGHRAGHGRCSLQTLSWSETIGHLLQHGVDMVSAGRCPLMSREQPLQSIISGAWPCSQDFCAPPRVPRTVQDPAHGSRGPG